MAKATEINCPKCHAQVLMRFAGKDGIQCKRCYYWIPRDIMLKLVSEQEGEAVVIQPEPEEEESFVICSKCHHKTFYSKIMDGGVMCKKCYNWIVVEESPEIPPVIEEAIMHRHSFSRAQTTEDKHTTHEPSSPSAKPKEHIPEFTISGGNYIVGKTLEEIPVKAEKIAIVGKDILPVEESHSKIPSIKSSIEEESHELDWFRHKTSPSHSSDLEDNKPSDVSTKQETKESWYISRKDFVRSENTESVEEKEQEKKEQKGKKEEKSDIEERSGEKTKSKRYKPRRKDFTHSEGGKRKIKAKSPGKESRVFKKATKKLVTRRKHEKEAEPEAPVKETPVEVTEDAPVIITPAPAVKEEPKAEIEAVTEKAVDLKEKVEEIPAPAPPVVEKEPVIALTEQMEKTPEKPVKEESAVITSEPVLAMPAPSAKKEKLDVDTVELPIPVPEKSRKLKFDSDDFKTEIMKEPPLVVPPPPEKTAEPVIEEKAIPMGSGEKPLPATERPELDEAFIAAYLPKNLPADVMPISEDVLPEVPEEEIIALMPEMDIADEDILDFLVEPPDFEIPDMDAVKNGESQNEPKGNDAGSSLTDSAILQIQQPEIVVRQIPASMRPKMTSMLGKPSRSDDLDLPQKSDYSTTKLPKKPPVDKKEADEFMASTKPFGVSAKPVESSPKPRDPSILSARENFHPPATDAKPPVSHKSDAGSVKPASQPIISVRVRTPEIKKHSLPAPSSAHKTVSHPSTGTPVTQPDVSQKPSVPVIPSKPHKTAPVVPVSRPVVPNAPVIKKDSPDAGKTPQAPVTPGKPKTTGVPSPSVLNRKIIAPKKIDISGVFKKKQ